MNNLNKIRVNKTVEQYCGNDGGMIEGRNWGVGWDGWGMIVSVGWEGLGESCVNKGGGVVGPLCLLFFFFQGRARVLNIY